MERHTRTRYTSVFPEKICKSATEVLYCTEIQRDMTVADLLQIVDIVADYVVLSACMLTEAMCFKN